MLIPERPVSAYQRDLARRTASSGNEEAEGLWVAFACAVDRAGTLPALRPQLVARLRAIALRAPDGTELPAEPSAPVLAAFIRNVAQVIEDGAALHLAYSILASAAVALPECGELESGRMLAQRARIAWKIGELDQAREHYSVVELRGRRHGLHELTTRAWVGFAILAHLRGNYPQVRRWCSRALAMAERHDLSEIGALAHQVAMICAGVEGDLSLALVHGWSAFRGVTGDSEREAEVLLNLSELLLRAGRPEEAAHGFASALSRKPSGRVALPALGGQALALAVCGDWRGVREVRAQAESVILAVALPFQTAGTLVELARALAAVGDERDAAECRARAGSIAAQYGYHEISHRVEHLEERADAPLVRDVPHALAPEAEEVAHAVTSSYGHRAELSSFAGD
jgi:tetratricopeptide (TPR) repeat protein